MKTFAAAEAAVSRRQPNLKEFRNFLVPQYPLALGTAVHATPLISALHAAVPGARIIAAASGFAAEVLRGNPGLEELLVTPSPLTDLFGAVRALRGANVFAGEPFAVLQTTGNERSRVTLAAMATGGASRVGFTVTPELSRAPLAFDARLSQIQNNLRIVSALGHGQALVRALQDDPDLLEPRLYPSAEDLRRARALLVENGVALERPFAVFVTQTSATQRKGWRVERFRMVAEALLEEFGLQAVFVGTVGERAAVDALREPLLFPTANLAGRTGLLELTAVLGMARIAITLDTGPLHLARAAGTPCVILAPAWSPVVEWLPVASPRAKILKNLDLPAAPVDYVIDEVSADEVLAAARELLATHPIR